MYPTDSFGESYYNDGYTKIMNNTIDFYKNSLDLYKEACAFANNYNGGAIVQNSTTEIPNVSYNGNKISVGPYNITSNCKITGVKYYQKTGTSIVEINNDNNGINLYSDKKGTNKINLSTWTGGTFYIVIDTTKVSPSNIEKIEFTYTTTTLKGTMYYMTKGTNQKLVSGYIERGNGSQTTDISIQKELIPPVKIRLNKKSTLKNDDGQYGDLAGATFTISYGDGEKNMPLMSGATTQYYYSWQPTNTNDIDVIIKETATPSKHQTLSGDIKIKLKLQNGQWVPTIESNPDNFVTITRGTRS